MLTIEEIKKEVKRTKQKSSRARYSKELIRSVVFHLNQGEKLLRLSRQTGISHQAIRDWREKHSLQEIPIHRFPMSGEKVFCLTYPDGSFVEGLSLEDLKSLRACDVVSKKGA